MLKKAFIALMKMKSAIALLLLILRPYRKLHERKP